MTTEGQKESLAQAEVRTLSAYGQNLAFSYALPELNLALSLPPTATSLLTSQGHHPGRPVGSVTPCCDHRTFLLKTLMEIRVKLK